MLEWLPSALPISVGPYGLELIGIDAEGVRLKFFGLERYRGDVDRPAFAIECGFRALDDPRFELAVRAWLTVVNDVFAAAEAWPRDTERWLGPMDVCASRHFEKVLKKKAAKDEAQLADEWRVLFAEFLPPRPELLEAAAELDALYADGGTIGRTDSVALEVVDEEGKGRFAKVEGGCVRLVLRLIVWSDGQIRDIKEQHCVVISEGELTRARVRAAFEAWGEVLPRLLTRLGDDVDTQMPHDLLPDFLDLVKPQTKDDFVAVLEKRWKLPAIVPQG
jgi:hypothetical protein